MCGPNSSLLRENLGIRVWGSLLIVLHWSRVRECLSLSYLL